MLIPCDKIWTLIFASFLHIVLSTFYCSQNYLVILSSYALVFLFLGFGWNFLSAETLFSSLHNLFLKFYSNFTSSVTPSPTIPFLCDFLFPEFQIIISHLSVVHTLHGDSLFVVDTSHFTLHVVLLILGMVFMSFQPYKTFLWEQKSSILLCCTFWFYAHYNR